MCPIHFPSPHCSFSSPSCHVPSPSFHRPHTPPCKQGLTAVGGVQWVAFVSGGEGVLPPIIVAPPVVAPRYHPTSSCSWQVFRVLLVMVIARLWSSWSVSWACATTQPPHEQGLVAVVGVGQGVRVAVINIIFISRKKKRNKEKNLPMATPFAALLVLFWAGAGSLSGHSQ